MVGDVRMEIVILVFIIIGSLLMVTNIIRYIYFVRTTHDVLSAGSKRDRAWKYVALVLLIFFLIGYLSIAIFSEPDMMMAMILFGGSVFVAIVLTLIPRSRCAVPTRNRGRMRTR